MLSTTRRFAVLSSLSLGLLTAAVECARAASGVPVETLDATSGVVSQVAPHVEAAPLPGILACTGGTDQQCFEPGGSPSGFVNVGSFFDRSQRTQATNFFLKLFTPPDSTAAYQLVGFSFIANRGGFVFPSAGVVTTSATTPVFPNPEQLSRLQRQSVTSIGGGQPTCVDLDVTVGSGELAWLVLQFPNAADSVFIGVRSESDATDHPCDFMTRDSGDYYYRPDPTQSRHDWQMTATFTPRAASPRAEMVWSNVKSLYR